MKTITKILGVVAAFGCLLAGGSARAASQSSLDLGTEYHTWSSNFLAKGYETALPLSFLFQDRKGRIQVSASTGFVQGHYATKSLGVNGTTFDGNRMTDSKVGLGLSLPLGSWESALALQANLPTGDPQWERLEGNAYVPNLFETSRYQGRGFGLNGLIGLGKDVGGHWVAMLSGGYLYSATVDEGLDWGKIKPGSYAVFGGSIGKRVEGFSVRLKAMEYLAQDTTAGDSSIYRAPSNTVLGFHLESGRSVRFLLDATYALYGKAKLLNIDGGLSGETKKSFGNRLSLHPAMEYAWGPKVWLGTGFSIKWADANGYQNIDALYNGGGSLIGVDQSLRLKMGAKVSTKYTLSYARITANDAAYDVTKSLTDVHYDDVSFGMGVEYQW